MWKTYTMVINQYNKLYSKKHGDTFLPINPRTLHSIKSHWNAKLQPCINKFASLVVLNRPKLGQVQDDKQMDLYWGECVVFTQRGQRRTNICPKQWTFTSSPTYGGGISLNSKNMLGPVIIALARNQRIRRADRDLTETRPRR